MRVGQQNEINRMRIEGKRLPVTQGGFAPALQHAAVNQETGIGGLDQEARSGNLTGGTEESNVHRAASPGE